MMEEEREKQGERDIRGKEKMNVHVHKGRVRMEKKKQTKSNYMYT